MTRRTKVLAGLLALTAAAAGAVTWWSLRGPRLPPPPTPEQMAALTAKRDRLQARFREVVVAHGEKSLAQAPRADVMLGIPTSLTASILEQVVTGLLGETTLTLKNLKVHKAGVVRAKMLLRKRTLGQYVLDVRIQRIRGLLKPGPPKLGFGGNTVEVTLPVVLAEGGGEAELGFKWDSKGVEANVVCGDIDIKRAVSGGVVPQSYELSGSFAIAAVGETVVLRPRFPDLMVRIFVDPSEQAWGVVDGVVKEQRKGCEIALTKVDIKEKLGGILGRGFNVRIPQKILKPVVLPAGVRQSLRVQGVDLALEVKPTGVLVAEDRIWYGADFDVRRKSPGAAKPGP